MTTTAQFEYAIREGLSNRQAKKRMRASPEIRFYVPTRGGPIRNTGKKCKKSTAKK